MSEDRINPQHVDMGVGPLNDESASPPNRAVTLIDSEHE
jgi:hypothetical protein